MDQAPEVVNVPEANRYEAYVDGVRAGVAEYMRTPELVAFVHTEVDPKFEGRGIGSALARTSLDEAREAGLKVLPVCPFYIGWISKHPEYEDLVYTKTSTAKD